MVLPSFSFFSSLFFSAFAPRAAVSRRGVSTPRGSLVGSPPLGHSTPLFSAHPCLLAVAFRRWIGSFSPFRSPFSPSRGAQRAFAERWIRLFCRLPWRSFANGLSVRRFHPRQRAISAQKGRFHRPFSENSTENALCTLCCACLFLVLAPVMGICRRQSATLRVLAPLRPLQVRG